MTVENTIATSLRADSRQPVCDVAQGFSSEIRPKGLSYIFNWLLIILFFLLPFQTRYIFREVPLYEYGTLSVFAVEVLGWVVIVLGLARFQVSGFRFQVVKWPIALLVLGALSILWAPDKIIALQAVVRLLEGVLLFLVIRQVSGVRCQVLVGAFLAGAILQAALGIHQFLTQSTFSSSWLGIALHDPATLGTAVVEAGGVRWLRAYGGLPHPNVFGGYLVVALAFVFRLISKASTSQRRGYLLFAIGYLILTGIFFSFSRAAWVVVFCTLAWVVIQDIRKRTSTTKGPIGPFVVVLVLLGFLVVWYRPLVIARIAPQDGGRLEVISRVERVQGVREAWEIIKRHPVFGVGIGNYTQSVARELRPSQPLYTYQPVHSVPLLVWAELGTIGFLLFLGALWAVARTTQNYWLLAIGYWLLVFDHYLWTLPFGILLFWAILGLSTALTPPPLDKKTAL